MWCLLPLVAMGEVPCAEDLADDRLWLNPTAALRYRHASLMNSVPSTPTALRTVLVVEDNDVYRQVVCTALQRQFPGWEILSAASLADARKLIGSKKVDVAVTDLSLPDGSGLDLLPHLAAQVAKGLKLVALTNDSSQDVLQGLKSRGYHGFVAKEHGIKVLCDAVRTVLAGKDFVSEPSQE
jgi:DNA-binding NarL/FixJ family response regulator